MGIKPSFFSNELRAFTTDNPLRATAPKEKTILLAYWVVSQQQRAELYPAQNSTAMAQSIEDIYVTGSRGQTSPAGRSEWRDCSFYSLPGKSQVAIFYEP
jgi:hypothetical protein